jgi:two-component system LytT family sensor kinase
VLSSGTASHPVAAAADRGRVRVRLLPMPPHSPKAPFTARSFPLAATGMRGRLPTGRIIHLVPGDAQIHARGLAGPCFMSRLRGLAVIAAVWTLVASFGALSTYVRSTSGELTLGAGWFWGSVGMVPVWTAATLPILALSRRLPFDRRTWRSALIAHVALLLVVFAVDGLASMVISPTVGSRRLTFWQQMWRYSFAVMVEHAARYYRMYLDRRIRAAELEAQVSRAQLQALQMQIRPHFLFNALNTISGLVRVDDKASAITMLAGLGDLLRMLLRSDGSQEVPVRQEVELIEHYLQIEQVRFGDQLAIEVSVEPEVEDALVPNLILQPLVENAVRHGVGGATGRVAVTVRRVGATLRMEVSDSGEVQPHDGERVGIGLSNTRARLERLYGGVHRFELTQTAAGTSAIIEIPFHQQSLQT